MFDVEGKGIITKEKLLNSMKTINKDISEEEIDGILKNISSSEDGITFKVFLELMEKRVAEKKADQDIKIAFDVLDIDHSGYIDCDYLFNQMLNLHESLSDAEIREMIREADMDGDNKLTFSEFINLTMG